MPSGSVEDQRGDDEGNRADHADALKVEGARQIRSVAPQGIRRDRGDGISEDERRRDDGDQDAQEGNGSVQKIDSPSVNHSAGRGIPVVTWIQPKTPNRVPLRAQPKMTREVVDMKMFPVPLGDTTASTVTRMASQPIPRATAISL